MAQITCEQFACVVCGFCKKSSGKTSETNKPLKRTSKSKAKRKGKRGMLQIADAILVYVLGTNSESGQTVKQLDVYSGVNGYHIRTIPATRRWRHPVMIGAGDGMLAVVDRFQDVDVIRVTDKYAGAGAEAFDDEGMPKDEIDWENIPDITQITAPSGSKVKGVTILQQGILIATIDDGSGLAKFLKADIEGRIAGKPNEAFEGVKALWPEGVNVYGPLANAPNAKETDVSEEVFWFLSSHQSGDSAAISVVDCRDGKIKSLLAMPNNPQIMGVAYSDDTVTVAVGDGNIISKLYRFVIENNTFLMTSAISVKGCPNPEEYSVSVMPSYQDLKSETGQDIKAVIRKYWNIATTVNEGRILKEKRNVPSNVNLRQLKEAKSSTELNDNRASVVGKFSSPNEYRGARIPVMEIECPAGLRLKSITANFGVIAELFQRVDADGQPDNRQPLFRLIHGNNYDFLLDGGWTQGATDSQTKEEFATTNSLVAEDIAIDKDYDMGSLKGVDFRVAMIDQKTGLLVYRYPKPLKGSLSEGKPYKLYSGDYASIKPYSPGSVDEEITNLENSNADLDQAMDAIDTDTTLTPQEKEQLKDEKANEKQANLDRLNYLRGLGSTGSVVQKTSASDETDALATEIDGIKRPERVALRDPATLEPDGDTYPVAEFNNNEDCDESWALFMRRVQAPRRVTVTPTVDRWNMREPDPVGFGPGAWYPEYREYTFPMKAVGSHQMFFPPRSHNTNKPKFAYTGRGGFFVPNWPQVNTTNHAVWREEIADITESNEYLNSQLAGEQSKPEEEQNGQLIASLTQRISYNNSRIGQLNNNIAGTPEELVVKVPNSILKHQYPGLQLSPAQELDADAGEYDKEELVGRTGLPEWGVTTIGDDSKARNRKRAIVFKTDCRTWIVIDVKLDRGGVITDGVASWVHPATIANGLGIPVGAFDWESMHPEYANAFGIVKGSVYEAGYRSYWDEGGAEGHWKIECKIDGVDHYDLVKQGKLHKPTFWEIFYRAPAEMQQYLLQMKIASIGAMTGVTPNRGWHPIYIYYTDEVIKSITVKAQLWNYAFDVFRMGARTIAFEDPSGDSPICPKTDPGYWAGDNCEGSACGNLTCPSAMFGWRHKLYSTDPTYPITKQLVWEGNCKYMFKEDPYADRGVLYGRLWDCYMDFDLNNPMTAFNVDIRP